MQRLAWIDNVKAICMLCVIFGHCCGYYQYGGESLLVGLFHPFYVAAFFFVSGYLYVNKLQGNKNTIGSCLGNILYRMVIPAIIFSALLFLPKALFHGAGFSIREFLLATIGGCNFWFVSAIVVAQLILLFLFMVTKCRKEIVLCVATLVIAIIGYFLSRLQPDPFPWFYKSGMLDSFFMALGALYRKYEVYISWRKVGWIIPVLYLGLVVYFWPKGMVHSGMIMVDFTIMGGVCTALGILSVIYIAKLIPQNKICQYIGQNSILYYFQCGLFPAVCSTLIGRIYPDKSMLMLLVVFCVAMVAMTMCTWIINRFLPWLIDLRKVK